MFVLLISQVKFSPEETDYLMNDLSTFIFNLLFSKQPNKVFKNLVILLQHSLVIDDDGDDVCGCVCVCCVCVSCTPRWVTFICPQWQGVGQLSLHQSELVGAVPVITNQEVKELGSAVFLSNVTAMLKKKEQPDSILRSRADPNCGAPVPLDFPVLLSKGCSFF